METIEALHATSHDVIHTQCITMAASLSAAHGVEGVHERQMKRVQSEMQRYVTERIKMQEQIGQLQGEWGHA